MDDHFEKPAETTGQRMTANRWAPPTNCATCGGDRFVVIAVRAATQTPWMKAHGIKSSTQHGIDEYAACPDCATDIDTSFRRFDMMLAAAPDAARVRELMRR